MNIFHGIYSMGASLSTEILWNNQDGAHNDINKSKQTYVHFVAATWCYHKDKGHGSFPQ